MTDEEMSVHLERVYAVCATECQDRARDRGGECAHLCQRVEREIARLKGRNQAAIVRQKAVFR